MRNKQQLAIVRVPDNKKAAFVRRMVRIVKRIGKSVAKNRRSIFKRNFVFANVTRCFLFVPIKPHNPNITILSLFPKPWQSQWNTVNNRGTWW